MSALIPWWLLPTVFTVGVVIYFFWAVFRARGVYAHWDVFLAGLLGVIAVSLVWFLCGWMQ